MHAKIAVAGEDDMHERVTEGKRAVWRDVPAALHMIRCSTEL
jgi:hypothetical protein